MSGPVCAWNMIDADTFTALSDSRNCLTAALLRCGVWQKIGSCVSCQRPSALFLLSGGDRTIKSWSRTLFPSWGWMYMTWFGRASAQLPAVSQTFSSPFHFFLVCVHSGSCEFGCHSSFPDELVWDILLWNEGCLHRICENVHFSMHAQLPFLCEWTTSTQWTSLWYYTHHTHHTHTHHVCWTCCVCVSFASWWRCWIKYNETHGCFGGLHSSESVIYSVHIRKWRRSSTYHP